MSSILISDTIDDEIQGYKGVVAEDGSIKDKALQEYLPASSACMD